MLLLALALDRLKRLCLVSIRINFGAMSPMRAVSKDPQDLVFFGGAREKRDPNLKTYTSFMCFCWGSGLGKFQMILKCSGDLYVQICCSYQQLGLLLRSRAWRQHIGGFPNPKQICWASGNLMLVGGFNPVENISQKLDNFPRDRGENSKNMFETTTQNGYHLL